MYLIFQNYVNCYIHGKGRQLWLAVGTNTYDHSQINCIDGSDLDAVWRVLSTFIELEELGKVLA